MDLVIYLFIISFLQLEGMCYLGRHDLGIGRNPEHWVSDGIKGEQGIAGVKTSSVLLLNLPRFK